VAYVLGQERSPRWADLGDAEAIDRSIVEFRKALADPNNSDVRTLARALDERVMRPVRKLLGGKHNILISPDGALNLIPFAALVDEQGRYLVENYTITYLTSGRDLLRLQTRSESRGKPVVIADPAFDLAIGTGEAAEEDGEAARGRRSVDFGQLKFGPLKGTAGEASALSSMMRDAQVLTGPQATEAALKHLAGPRLLHVATHGFFLPDAPDVVPTQSRGLALGSNDWLPTMTNENPLLRSGLALAGVNRRQSGPGEDGIVTALEVAGLDLWGTKLVVLSACETGVGEARRGEGVYGLRRALALAGAESELMSLWKVHDTATRDLMIEYYKRLGAHEGRSEALRDAQLGMLLSRHAGDSDPERRGLGLTSKPARGDYSHPYFWASFIPVGDWRKL